MATILIDARKFRAALAARGEQQYRFAVALGIAPAKLSALVHGHLRAEEAERLRAKIEGQLGLDPGSLAGGGPDGSKPRLP